MAGLDPAIHVFERERSKHLECEARGSSPRASLTPFASACFIVPFFAGLVVIARSLYPIPSRTRPSKSSAPMVLSLKAWKSRSPPGLPRTEHPPLTISNPRSVSAIEQKAASGIPAAAFLLSAARRIIGKTAPDWRVWKYGFVFVLTDDVHSAERIGGDTRGRRGDLIRA